MDILIRLGQLFLALSILVILHEFGHFFFAKLFKTRVEKFYLFFDPWFSLIKFKRGDTEYGIGWLPLGGYVKISGMIDESMDKEQLAKPAEPWEFRAKPAWQRLLIMTGGVLVNFLLAFVIYILSLYSFGEEYLPTSQAKDGIYIEGALKDIGFQNGDQIVAIDGKPVTDVFQKIKHDILFSKDRHIEFVRDGQKMDLNISDAQISELIAEKRDGIFAPRLPFFVGSFAGGSLAQKAGLKENDKLTGINDKTLRFFDEFVSELQGLKSQKIVLHFERENKPMQIDVQLDDTGKIGVAPQSDLSKLFTLAKKDYGLVQSIPAGITRGVESIDSYLSQLRLIFSPGTGAYKEVGGFGMIASIFPTVWDWQNFWLLTAMLSIMLAVLNILPIPALDGGHVMFTLYEIITRRKPSEKFLEYAQIVGMVFLLGLVVYANGMDIFRFLIK